MTSSIDGLVSGLDTTALIEQLMDLERIPQLRLAAKRDAASKVIAAFQGLNTKLASARVTGRTLADPAMWAAKKATSSNTDVATATASSSALSGSLTFTVDALATSGSAATSGTVSSTASVVASGPILLATGTSGLGITSLKADGGLTVGDHVVKVTQASTAAEKVGTAPLAATTTVDGLTLEYDIDGVAQGPVVLAGTNLTAAQVAAEVQAKTGGTLTADIDDTGALRLRTVDEGTDASLQITGGTALGVLNLSVDGAAITGTDGLIDVGGVITTVSDARAGATVDLGTVTAVLAGGLRSGSVTAKAIDHGDGSLSAVVSAINGAKHGVSAAAVQVAPGAYKLQLSATKSGTAGALAIASDAFSGMGTLQSTGQATDASITVGSGPGSYTISSSTNQLTSLLPGVTITLTGTGTTTIGADRDASALADLVGQMVTAANTAMTEIKTLTAYDAENGTAGLLLGNYTVRQIRSQISTSIIDPVVTSALASGGLAGVSTTKDGSITFDRTKFLAAFADDPDAVAALFTRGGTSTSAKVSLSTATDRTREGTYAVVVTQAAERAERAGADLAGAGITASETIDIRVGGATGTTVSYTAAAGETADQIADGINEQLALASLNIVASVENGALVIRTLGYGAIEKFEVRSDQTGAGQTGIVGATGQFEQEVGVDVAGTINGVAATGAGQLLLAPGSDENLASLRLLITATPDDVALSTNFGTFTYVRGIGQRIASTANDAIDTVSGSITSAIEGRRTEISRLTDEITNWETRLEQRELQLRRKFTAMEVALSRAKTQSEWLAGQIAGLMANSAAARR